MLLTRDGLLALADFTIRAAPEEDENFNRVGHDGILLECVHPHDDKVWRKQWAVHVAPPSLRDLVFVAQQHWAREHRATQTEGTEAEVAK